MITLSLQESMRVTRSDGSRIACLSGVIWVTREDDTRDFILAHGDSVEVGSGVTMVMALEPTVLSIAKRNRVSWPRRLFQAMHVLVRTPQQRTELVTLRTL